MTVGTVLDAVGGIRVKRPQRRDPIPFFGGSARNRTGERAQGVVDRRMRNPLDLFADQLMFPREFQRYLIGWRATSVCTVWRQRAAS